MVEIYGCDFFPEEKIVMVTQCSYISEEAKNQLEEQGWKIIEGVLIDKEGKPLPKNPPTFPLISR